MSDSNSNNNLIEIEEEDGSVVLADLELSDKISRSVIESLLEMSDNPDLENYHAITTLFSVFSDCAAVLMQFGWTPEELANHCNDLAIPDRGSMN